MGQQGTERAMADIKLSDLDNARKILSHLNVAEQDSEYVQNQIGVALEYVALAKIKYEGHL